MSKRYRPMEALPAEELPTGPEWQYEAKWDGFRCLAFRDHKRVDLLSKSGKPLTRYFPELVAAESLPNSLCSMEKSSFRSTARCRSTIC